MSPKKSEKEWVNARVSSNKVPLILTYNEADRGRQRYLREMQAARKRKEKNMKKPVKKRTAKR